MIYADPVQAQKLEEAIARGYIIRRQDADGVLRYELTGLGQMQWAIERSLKL